MVSSTRIQQYPGVAGTAFQLPFRNSKLRTPIVLPDLVIGRSAGGALQLRPDSKLSDIRAGLSERLIDGETWRVDTIEDVAKGVRVLVGDRLGLREHLARRAHQGSLPSRFLIDSAAGLPDLEALIADWKPLQAIARELSSRSADDMSPMETGRVPNRNSPGHCIAQRAVCESAGRASARTGVHRVCRPWLRTPLAGLRTQAQISTAATERPVRETALRLILSR